MNCHICGTNNNIKECSHYVLNKTEYFIEQHKRNILIRDKDKRYIAMFKYENSHWCFALPIKTMYLQTIPQVKKDIQKQKEYDISKGWKCEYKIAEIMN